MERKNLEKNLREILISNYVVPLYQRNYAWGENEIFQLVQDIYEKYKSAPESNYYIGTLVVLKRLNGDYEVIDGQQRLTTVTLISKLLDSDLKESKLKYDSRAEVEVFLNNYYQHGEEGIVFNEKVNHFVDAIAYIKTTNVTPKEDNHTYFKDITNEDLEGFKEYFFSKVILIRVEIPRDTDVAHYFEVMNNRGEQLEKHEILKARILEKLKGTRNYENYAKIWDACSQMNHYIQSNFDTELRTELFGNNWDSFTFNFTNNEDSELTDDSNEKSNPSSILDILNSKQEGKIEEPGNSKDDKFNSIIDFPNFLMHIFRLHLKDESKDIPLNGDDLLSVYDSLEDVIEPKRFIRDLLFYRLVFDRFILKSFNDEGAEDNYKWSLEKPELYVYVNKKQTQKRLNHKKTFESQERIIKALSMLQVTFRTRKYKNWMQNVLSWFSSTECLNITGLDFQKKIDELILSTYARYDFSEKIEEKSDYAEGTSTPHFLFNFIDYLMYVDSVNKQKDNKESKKYNFEFKYRNSVEHHLPQSLKDKISKHSIDNLGNLCLVSKGLNSKMNNESPKGKADSVTGKFYKVNLPPKQKEMYNLTNKQGNWGDNEIEEHYKNVQELLKRKSEILNLDNNE